ncbi:MAG: hypothetical protein LH614_09435, partial [Pyrinomonadaceae bacterium]|nr:hypothetical protein [Pyrinomonadaceae bacterium]
MKKILIAGAILLSIAVFALTVFYPSSNTLADKDYPYEGNEPDMPAFLKTDISKKDFMTLRAEYVGLKRGYNKDEPADPQMRQTAIAEMERQQDVLAKMPESTEKNALLAAWNPIGPAPIPNGQTTGISTPVSGRTIAIAVHPTNPNIVYVGTAQGGLYRTTDGGTNWIPLMDNALSLAIGAVTIAPSQPETIYVGTGEPNFSNDSFFGVGIYRIDNASSASPTVTGPLNRNAANADVFTGASISKIVVSPTDPATIFATTSFGLGGIGSSFPTSIPSLGLFRSTNATATAPTFARMTIPGTANFLNFTDVVMEPGNANRLVMATGDPFGVGGNGIYLTTNALAATPTFTLSQSLATSDRTELAISKVGATVTVYAASGFNGGTVLRSIDGGASFTQTIDNNFCGGQCFYDVAIAVDPTNANNVFLGGDPSLIFASSTNGGTSFTRSEQGLHADSHAITVAPSLPTTVYFGSDGGIYKSINSGANWTVLNNTQFSATQFMSIAVHPTDPNFTIGGTQDNGTNFYRPNATWNRADFGDGGYALIDQNAADTTNVRMYHTYFNNGGLQGYSTVSTTASASDGNWTFRGCQGAGTTTNGITCGGAVLFYAPLEQGPGNPNSIYYGTDRLYRSTDAGLTHTVVSQNPITSSVPISAIGISPQNDNVRIVGQSNGGIWGTTTGSTTLTNLDAGNAVPNQFVARAVIDPNNVNTAYVSLAGFGVAGVWRTTNLNSGSPTWSNISGSGGTALPQVPVSAFLVDPTNSNTLYAGTDIGVYSSSDGGASWTPFGTGLPRVAVFDMAITANRTLRIATHGRGMWEMSLNTAPCVYAISPTSQSFPAAGGNGSFQVTTTSGCAWTAASNSFADAAAVVKTENLNDAVNAPTAVFPGTGVGAIPDNAPNAGLVVSFPVSGVSGSPTTVSVNMTLTHTWVGDLIVTLTAPGGSPSIPIYSRVGSTTATGFGDSSNLGGTYTFNDAATGNFWTEAAVGGDDYILTPGSYRTSAPLTGAPTNLTATFSGLTAAQANGTWTLTFTDNAGGDLGTVTAANLEILPTGG